MPDSPTSESQSDFVCDCNDQARAACAGEPFNKEHEGKRYCLLHFPGEEKAADFQKVVQQKLDNKDFDFRGAWFPDEQSFNGFIFETSVNFQFAVFTAKVSFDRARFNEAADFRDVKFKSEANFFKTNFGAYTYFGRADFKGEAIFTNAVFGSRAFFNHSTFNERTYFTSVVFGERAYFMQTAFWAEAYFTYTSFDSYVLFSGGVRTTLGDKTSLDFQFARFEKPERVSFHMLSLRPSWFANLDTRKFDLTNAIWKLDKRLIEKEIEELKRRRISPIHALLANIFGHLAVNAEDNGRFEDASRFRYLAMDVRRREKSQGLAFWRLSWWYWLASGYGERVLRAFVVLIGVLLVSACLYTAVGFANENDSSSAERDAGGAPMPFSRALTYSAAVMMLQKPEPKPATTAAQTVVLLETILGPLQAALLALAIRRKFMR